ncbi:signal peptide peptidase SppA [Candidatus Phycorickettsia trachydisci]|uniref:Signal peptide peptidase SppA n=1 Tax=Candidatus Phycorickettsia trachydisci TaxID=2115978 RepID=A0A2P1P7Z0_9RICK|nr:signal peptide peptidase SppA [Candidatus Phycorickettsia trachydisci]AVP87382.1 signal peptide peptidase SppA [Candidatus Phycorickettsia trachydisci]
MRPDYFIERKKLKQKITYFKIASVILIALMLSLGKSMLSDKKSFNSIPFLRPSAYIGAVYIDGVIMEDKDREKILEEIAENNKVKALIVHINSGGGSVAGSEQLYKALREISKHKPVVAMLDGIAASGGYMTALGADYIFARPATLTGSIGVIGQNFEVTELAKKWGVQFNTLKSSPLKAVPNWFEKLTPEGEKANMAVINDMYDYFVNMVIERRQIPKEEVLKIADGRIYTGRQAQAMKLVDKVGFKDDALKWLQEEKKIDPKLKVIELDLETTNFIIKALNSQIKAFISAVFHSFSGLFS